MFGLFDFLFSMYDDLETERKIHTVKHNDDHEPVHSLHRKE